MPSKTPQLTLSKALSATNDRTSWGVPTVSVKINMQPGKWTTIFLLCTLLIYQVEAASLSSLAHRAAVRLPRMTPFWRGLSLRPIGASCRDPSECLTRLCKDNRCWLKTFAD
ncbi:liver-expressed antimicrobial peptide 2 [Pelodytes ibericus]